MKPCSKLCQHEEVNQSFYLPHFSDEMDVTTFLINFVFLLSESIFHQGFQLQKTLGLHIHRFQPVLVEFASKYPKISTEFFKMTCIMLSL